LGRSTSTRVSTEIAALSVALEIYKADHGHYPHDPATTQTLKPRTTFDPVLYIPASRFLYRELSGDLDGDPSTKSPTDRKKYFEFPPAMLRTFGSSRNTYVADPWGNSYGYSTFKAAHPNDFRGGYNAAFDLWSTGGGTTQEAQTKWTRNW
jgi:hypothetical protein